jgi:hypothetical protein
MVFHVDLVLSERTKDIIGGTVVIASAPFFNVGSYDGVSIETESSMRTQPLLSLIHLRKHSTQNPWVNR